MGYLTTPKQTGIAVTPVGIAQSPYDRGSRGPIAYGGYRQPFAGAKALSMGYIINNASALGLTSSATEELAQESKLYGGMTDAQTKLLAAQPATAPTAPTTTPKVASKTTPSLAVVGGGGSSLLLLGGLVGIAAWLLFGKKSRAAVTSPRRRKIKRARKAKRSRRARRNPRWPRYRKAPRTRKARSTGKRTIVVRRERGLWNVYEISSKGSIWLAGQAMTRADALQVAYAVRRHSFA